MKKQSEVEGATVEGVTRKQNNKGKSGKTMYGIKNYLPPMPDGEDGETIKQHLKMMQSESKKDRQDVNLIEELMTLTMAYRHQMIVEEKWSIIDMKDKFSCLFNKDEVSSLIILKV